MTRYTKVLNWDTGCTVPLCPATANIIECYKNIYDHFLAAKDFTEALELAVRMLDQFMEYNI